MHSLIWFFFLRFCQHEIKHSNPIQSKDTGLKDIGHSMNIRNLTLGVNSVTVSYLICNDSLLQNGTPISLQNVTEVYYIMRQLFITKCNSFIIKCNSYYKLGRFYYKMRQLLENVMFLTNCDNAGIWLIKAETHILYKVFERSWGFHY